MFEFAWPWLFALLPLPWLMRAVLPVADSGEAALKISFLGDLEELARRKARSTLPSWRQQAPYLLLWLLLLTAAARPQWVGEPLPIAASGRDLLVAVDVSGSMDLTSTVTASPSAVIAATTRLRASNRSSPRYFIGTRFRLSTSASVVGDPAAISRARATATS